jgi:hypothetical protein
MSRGNLIVLTPDRGHFVEGIINAGETPKPGQIVQEDPTQALQGGRRVWKLYNRDADGNRPAGPLIVLTEDRRIGRTMLDAYAAGERAFGFIPLAGCELNLLYMNVSGTADDVAAGDLLTVDDSTGKVIVTTGTPEIEVAHAQEAIVDPTADTLLWSTWSGY